jgi:hypothetical protein
MSSRKLTLEDLKKIFPDWEYEEEERKVIKKVGEKL